jgi:hypothetical protein
MPYQEASPFWIDLTFQEDGAEVVCFFWFAMVAQEVKRRAPANVRARDIDFRVMSCFELFLPSDGAAPLRGHASSGKAKVRGLKSLVFLDLKGLHRFYFGLVKFFIVKLARILVGKFK